MSDGVAPTDEELEGTEHALVEVEERRPPPRALLEAARTIEQGLTLTPIQHVWIAERLRHTTNVECSLALGLSKAIHRIWNFRNPDFRTAQERLKNFSLAPHAVALAEDLIGKWYYTLQEQMSIGEGRDKLKAAELVQRAIGLYNPQAQQATDAETLATIERVGRIMAAVNRSAMGNGRVIDVTPTVIEAGRANEAEGGA